MCNRQNALRQNKCGVFVEFEVEDRVGQYLDSVLELNNFDQNIFKSLHWFIFLAWEGELGKVFRYDSNVYLVVGGREEGPASIVESYSVEKGVSLNRGVGSWAFQTGLG